MMLSIRLALLATASGLLSAANAAPPPKAPGAASAVPDPAQPGTEMSVDITLTLIAKTEFIGGNTTRKSSSIQHVAKGRCKLAAGMPGDWGVKQPTEAERAAYEKEKAKKPATGAEAIQGEIAACKNDQKCMMEAILRAQKSGALEATVKPQGRYQVWKPLSCSGEITVDDRHTGYEFDPGDTREYVMTMKGSAPVPKEAEGNWLGFIIEVNHEKGETAYHVNRPPRLYNFPRTTNFTQPKVKTVNDQTFLDFYNGNLPNPLGPFKGALKDGSATKEIDGGKLKVDWKLVN
jgi:hypothetical protein